MAKRKKVKQPEVFTRPVEATSSRPIEKKAKTKKVKILKPCLFAPYNLANKVGDTVELPIKVADQLIAMGRAE